MSLTSLLEGLGIKSAPDFPPHSPSEAPKQWTEKPRPLERQSYVKANLHSQQEGQAV
jgi:hypothetical protein